jgi:hypothetical protein
LVRFVPFEPQGVFKYFPLRVKACGYLGKGLEGKFEKKWFTFIYIDVGTSTGLFSFPGAIPRPFVNFQSLTFLQLSVSWLFPFYIQH